MNYADAHGKVPLVKIVIQGHTAWRGEHPIAKGAYKLDYITDEAYEVTPLHHGFADVANKFPGNGLNKWEVNVVQDVQGKVFPLFRLVEGQMYVDYDLIYIYNDMLFNGSKNVDGRAFDTPENRPTNVQIPLVRQKYKRRNIMSTPTSEIMPAQFRTVNGVRIRYERCERTISSRMKEIAVSS